MHIIQGQKEDKNSASFRIGELVKTELKMCQKLFESNNVNYSSRLTLLEFFHIR